MQSFFFKKMLLLLLDYFSIEVELLHVLVGVANADKSTKLRSLFGFSSPQHFFTFSSPAIAI